MKRSTEINSSTKSKMTVMLLQIEGTDDTVQEGFKALETALNKISPQIIMATSSPILPKAQQALSGSLAQTLNMDPEGAEVIASIQDESNTVDEDLEVQKVPTKRYYSTPNVITDLDMTKGNQNFKDYFAQLGKPTAGRQRYLIVALWLKENLGINEISVDHIYTAFKFMGWGVQKDVGQPLRTLKHEGLFTSGSSKKMFEINHIGIEAVRRMAAKE